MKKPRLTDSDRLAIETGLRSGKTVYNIAKALSRPVTTITREIRARAVESDKAAAYRVTNRCAFRMECEKREVCAHCLYDGRRQCRFCRQCNSHCPAFVEQRCGEPRLEVEDGGTGDVRTENGHLLRLARLRVDHLVLPLDAVGGLVALEHRGGCIAHLAEPMSWWTIGGGPGGGGGIASCTSSTPAARFTVMRISLSAPDIAAVFFAAAKSLGLTAAGDSAVLPTPPSRKASCIPRGRPQQAESDSLPAQHP